MDLNIQTIIFEFIGGLGIFLLGIKYMGEGLQKTAGDRLRNILDRFTSHPLLGVLAGIVITVLIQSSSGTTVLTVGLVNAGFMTLRQAIGVIMGANIGTTVTSFIIGLDIGAYALPIVAVGCFLLFFIRHEKVQAIGQAVFGFGALFFGLELMSGGMAPLQTLDIFQDLTVKMSDQPVFGVLIGTVFTVIVQSSSATIGILQQLFSEGAINLKASIPVLIGDNLGTTITAILAAIGSTVAAKRAAFTHVFFNLIGAIVFVVLLGLYTQLIAFLQGYLHLNPETTIAFAHGTFNIGNTLIQLPFVGALAWLVTKVIPGEDTMVEYKPKHLDPLFIQQSPSIALDQAKLEVIRMGNYAYKGLKKTADYLMTDEKKKSTMALQIEGALNNLDKEIMKYLIDISSQTISETESVKHTALMNSVRDIERIGDHFENIIELIDYKIMQKVDFSDVATNEIKEMFDLTLLSVKEAVQALALNDTGIAEHVMENEQRINKMEARFRKHHITRINQGVCQPTASILFADMLIDLERIGDHAKNIVEEVLESHVG